MHAGQFWLEEKNQFVTLANTVVFMLRGLKLKQTEYSRPLFEGMDGWSAPASQNSYFQAHSPHGHRSQHGLPIGCHQISCSELGPMLEAVQKNWLSRRLFDELNQHRVSTRSIGVAEELNNPFQIMIIISKIMRPDGVQLLSEFFLFLIIQIFIRFVEQ